MQRAKTEQEIQEVAFHAAVKRGVDLAQTTAVRILGRKPFSAVRVGRTGVDLGQAAQTRRGYSVHPLFTSPNAKAIEEIEKVLAAWLTACHGPRCEHTSARGSDGPVATGNKTVYLAVK